MLQVGCGLWSCRPRSPLCSARPPTITSSTTTATPQRQRRAGERGTDCEGDEQMAGPPRAAFVCCKGTLDRPCCFILTFPGGSLGCRDNAGNGKRKRAKFQNKNIFRRGSWTEGGGVRGAFVDVAQWLLKLARNGLMAGGRHEKFGKTGALKETILGAVEFFSLSRRVLLSSRWEMPSRLDKVRKRKSLRSSVASAQRLRTQGIINARGNNFCRSLFIPASRALNLPAGRCCSVFTDG